MIWDSKAGNSQIINKSFAQGSFTTSPDSKFNLGIAKADCRRYASLTSVSHQCLSASLSTSWYMCRQQQP